MLNNLEIVTTQSPGDVSKGQKSSAVITRVPETLIPSFLHELRQMFLLFICFLLLLLP